MLALFKEFAQLHDKKVFKAIKASDLTRTQKKNALRAINLIKEKRNGDLKGRTCADRSGQRKYVPREEAASPTLSLESLMSLLLISAHEERETAVFDVPGAYLHADIPGDKFVVLKIEGEFVNIMCQVNPEFTPYVREENQPQISFGNAVGHTNVVIDEEVSDNLFMTNGMIRLTNFITNAK